MKQNKNIEKQILDSRTKDIISKRNKDSQTILTNYRKNIKPSRSKIL